MRSHLNFETGYGENEKLTNYFDKKYKLFSKKTNYFGKVNEFEEEKKKRAFYFNQGKKYMHAVFCSPETSKEIFLGLEKYCEIFFYQAEELSFDYELGIIALEVAKIDEMLRNEIVEYGISVSKEEFNYEFTNFEARKMRKRGIYFRNKVIEIDQGDLVMYKIGAFLIGGELKYGSDPLLKPEHMEELYSSCLESGAQYIYSIYFTEQQQTSNVNFETLAKIFFNLLERNKKNKNLADSGVYEKERFDKLPAPDLYNRDFEKGIDSQTPDFEKKFYKASTKNVGFFKRFKDELHAGRELHYNRFGRVYMSKCYHNLHRRNDGEFNSFSFFRGAKVLERRINIAEEESNWVVKFCGWVVSNAPNDDENAKF